MRYVENLDDTVTDHTGGGDIHANYQIRNRTCILSPEKTQIKKDK